MNHLKKISILGSTGSIGLSTIDLIERDRQNYDVVALTAHKNVDRLAAQAKSLNAEMAVIADESLYEDLKQALSGTKIKAMAGRAALNEAAESENDIVMAAIVGAAGLEATLSAVRKGTDIALANKECLVCAGELMIDLARRSGSMLLPVDSEHNAIFQVLDPKQADKIDKITLTASGGPFQGRNLSEMQNISPSEAVAHPNWKMGAKISVDSATMMNKGLELIEAYHLFPVDAHQLDIIIHPQSVIHSMVSYVDGTVLAQLGSPDMRIPISYVMNYPNRNPTPAKTLNLKEIGRLDFFDVDEINFPATKIAREALQLGGSTPTILNAANEVAVYAFLEGKIKFLKIVQIIEQTLEIMGSEKITSLEALYAKDEETRIKASELIKREMI